MSRDYTYDTDLLDRYEELHDQALELHRDGRYVEAAITAQLATAAATAAVAAARKD